MSDKKKTPEEIANLARTAFRAFLRWFEQTKLEVVETEMHLVSEDYRFGGTPDAVGMIQRDDGSLEYHLLDWKTSNRLYGDHVIQLAAYRHLWEANHPDMPLSEFHVLRAGKEYAEFSHHGFPPAVIDMGWDAFTHLRRVYDLDRELKKVTG